MRKANCHRLKETRGGVGLYALTLACVMAKQPPRVTDRVTLGCKELPLICCQCLEDFLLKCNSLQITSYLLNNLINRAAVVHCKSGATNDSHY